MKYNPINKNLLTYYGKRTIKMTLDNFTVTSIQIGRLTDSFNRRDHKRPRGFAPMGYEDFIGLAMRAHN